MGIDCHEVRSLEELKPVTHLIIPGGESTVIAQFLDRTGVGNEIRRRVKWLDLAVYGTCAGAILIAKNVKGKAAPPSLSLMKLTIERNAYGRQLQSFEANIVVKGIEKPMHVAFIRAPKILKVGRKVEVLASHSGNPVLMKQGRVLAGTFHPEVRGSQEIHKLFLAL